MRRLLLYSLLTAGAAGAADDFVLVKGGLVNPNANDTRVDDFEILDHPLTNAEYKLFIDATKHTPPQHWQSGRIPAGTENHPVVFVNRYDVAAYLSWRSKKENRAYRLPTAAEFEYAARGGQTGAKYPWGNEDPAGKANYNASDNRTFADWRKSIDPVKKYPANPYSLYDMAGNVWQMVDNYPDPATVRFKYDVTNLTSLEQGLMGGSWARSELYMRCGVRGGLSPGIWHPDAGFRPVREPAGQTSFQRQPRRVIAANAGNGAVYVGWQLLPGDNPATGFHVYRTSRRDVAGERLTKDPIHTSTNYMDSSSRKGRVYYRVRPVRDGKEGPPSEWAGMDAGGERNNVVAEFEVAVKQGGVAPIFGDLDGDGRLDAVLRIDNGIREMSRDPGVPVELEAFNAHGRSLWRRPLVFHDHCFGNANNVPVLVYDMDGDGKAEVLAQIQENDQLYVSILDGLTGRVLRKTPWTPMHTDFGRSSTRVHMSVAYLDGKTPAIVTQTGLYENEIYDAYDNQLKKLWQYRSFGETNGSGSHHVDIADVDGDGRDEVFNGTTLLNPDGTVRWSIYRLHPDIVSIKRILPGTKDRQVFFAVETHIHAGAYLVDAKSGKIIWKTNREDDQRWSHAHTGWASDIWEGAPGIEMLTNRDGHAAEDLVLFAADGKIIMNPFPGGWRPVNWTGGKVRDLMNRDATQIGRFDGKTVTTLEGVRPNVDTGGCNMAVDFAGDYRDEIVCVSGGKVRVLSNIEPVDARGITRTADREYRLWIARNIGGGYNSYFEWEPLD